MMFATQLLDPMNISSNDRAIFLARLIERRGIPLGVAWQEVMPYSSIRLHFLIERNGIETLGDILRALGNDNKNSVLGTNVTRTAIAELWEALELLAGPAVTHFDPSIVESVSAETFFSNLPRKSV